MRNELILETAWTIFLKLGMNLWDKKSRNIFVCPNLPKRAKIMAILAQKQFFGTYKKLFQQIFWNYTKSRPKIVLYDRIVIFAWKIQFESKFGGKNQKKKFIFVFKKWIPPK